MVVVAEDDNQNNSLSYGLNEWPLIQKAQDHRPWAICVLVGFNPYRSLGRCYYIEGYY